MRRIILAILFLFTFKAFAFESPSANTESPHAILFNAGFTRGGMALGFDYEYAYHRTFGIGGYVRLYPDEDSINQGSLSTFGFFIRPHFTRQSWDLYVSPGVGLTQEEIGNNNDESYIGPALMLGLLYQLNNRAALGIENMQIYGWIGDERARGLRSNELLLKFRYSLN